MVAGLLLFEGGVRVWSSLFFPKMIRLDDRLGWRRRPDTSKTFQNHWSEHPVVVANRYGNRGVAHPPERRPGTYRVLALGDSFAEGAQVAEEDLFSAKLEASRSGLEVINAGVVAYGTVQEYLYLRDEGLRFRPDLVLILLYQNDLTDNVLPYSLRMGPRPYAVPEDGGARIVEGRDWGKFSPFCIPLPFSTFLFQNSFVFYALNDRVYYRMRRKELHGLDRENMDEVSWPDRMGVLFGVLDLTRDLAAGAGAELAVFLIPTKQEIAAGESADHDEIARWCAGHGVGCIRGLEPMRLATAQGRQPYFKTDIHWTKLGHAIAAEEIARFVDERRK